MVRTENRDFFVNTIPVKSVYIKTMVQPRTYMKVSLLLVILMSVFILIASENMLHFTPDINIYFINKQKEYIIESEKRSELDHVKTVINNSHVIYDVAQIKFSPVNISNGSQPIKSDSQLSNHAHVVKQRLLCKRQKNLAFIKTHKTGSTTLASIMHRYALSYRLSCLGYKSDPTRGHIRFDLLNKRSNRKFIPPLGVRVGDYANYKRYNMLAVHVRYQPKMLNVFMAQGTKYVTILREPSSHFESAFSFFGAEKALFRRTDRSGNLGEFAKHPNQYWNRLPRSHKKYYTRNGQMFDLSLDHRIHTDLSVVQSIIDDIANKFSLVLIMEYMDESLLLLKKLMCWDYRDISYVTKNHRTHISKMEDSVRTSLRKWNWADALLYERFNATLWKKIKEYGPTFQDDLAKFREVLREDYDECVAAELSKKRAKVVKTKLANNSEYCTDLAGSSYRLFNKVYKRQMNVSKTN